MSKLWYTKKNTLQVLQDIPNNEKIQKERIQTIGRNKIELFSVFCTNSDWWFTEKNKKISLA